MTEMHKSVLSARDAEQAIFAIKRGAYLLKYGRRGRPKFCPFRLSSDESILIWYSGKEERQLKLSTVSRIIPGQCTAIFKRYPRPEKEYQSFSLICNDRTLDLICKDKDEAEIWLVALKALISHGRYQKWNIEAKCSSVSSGSSPHSQTQRKSPSTVLTDVSNNQQKLVPFENHHPQKEPSKAFFDIVSYPTIPKCQAQPEVGLESPTTISPGCVESSNDQSSTTDAFRVSLSSAVSSSSHESCQDDFDALGDVFIWGEGIGYGNLGGGILRVGNSSSINTDIPVPKALESTVVLDVNKIACGSKHAVLVTKQGEIFSWGEESGGRLGHGLDSDVSHPKLINFLSGMSVEHVACGEFHTCAVTLSGDLYSWGDGTHRGLLGNESGASHWIPKKVTGILEGLHVSYISCGPWHTAVVTSSGQLFSFGDGTFGALGHGDHSSTSVPREVSALKGLRTLKVACGVWHTAAVVDVVNESSSSGSLFTWGIGDKGQLGHGDNESRVLPKCVSEVVDESFCQVACGDNLTVSLTCEGKVYLMGSALYGQLGNPKAVGNIPTCVCGKLKDSFVEEIACGSSHVAVLTSKSEVYTWGKGRNGQLGHGDNFDRHSPTLIDFLKDKQVRSVVCGSNFSAVVCLHKWVSRPDHTVCSACHNPFGFRRKRHNCYNCGLVFCKVCSSRKSLKASLAPNTNKPYRVCDDCFTKLKKGMDAGPIALIPRVKCENILLRSNEVVEKGASCPVSQGDVSRFYSGQHELRRGRHESRNKLNDRHVFPPRVGNFNWGGYYSIKSTISQEALSKNVSPTSVSETTAVRQALSSATGMLTASGMSSPSPCATSSPLFYIPTSSEGNIVHPKHRNDGLSQEMLLLQTQVEDLTRKCEHLEAELERTSMQLKEATTLTANVVGNCKVAEVATNSPTVEDIPKFSKHKEVSERESKRYNSAVRSKWGSSIHRSGCNMECQTSLQTEPIESTTIPMLPNGSKSEMEKTKWVENYESGVYLTLSSLPGDGKELIRIRFSRKHFNEGDAEKWWTENASKVYERYNIQNFE